MALFGSNFATGFVKGLAESVDERLKDDMQRTFDRVDRAADYHIRRRAEEEDRYKQEMKDVEEVLNSLATFTGGDLDKAAQLYNSSGKTVAGGQDMVSYLTTAQRELGADFKPETFITYVQNETGGYGMKDYVDTFVNRPEQFAASKLPEDARQGVGLYKLFKPDVGGQIQKQVREIFPETARGERPTIDVSMASIDYSKLPSAQQYQRETVTFQLGVAESILNLQQKLREINMAGSLDQSQIYKDFNLVTKSFLDESNIPASVDISGNIVFDPSTVMDQREDISNAYDKGLTSVVEEVLKTNSLNVSGMQSTLKTLSNTSLAYNTPQTSTVGDMRVGGLYNDGGTPNAPERVILWLGGDYTDEPVEGKNYIVVRTL
jgi:hypothetical protein